jgi:hypothetical protein
MHSAGLRVLTISKLYMSRAPNRNGHRRILEVAMVSYPDSVRSRDGISFSDRSLRNGAAGISILVGRGAGEQACGKRQCRKRAVLPLQPEAAALAAGQGRCDLHAKTCMFCVFEAIGQPLTIVMDGH